MTTGSAGRDAAKVDDLDVMVEVQHPSTFDYHAKSEQHRQMARAAIRIALRLGATDAEIMAEYRRVQEIESHA